MNTPIELLTFQVKELKRKINATTIILKELDQEVIKLQNHIKFIVTKLKELDKQHK